MRKKHITIDRGLDVLAKRTNVKPIRKLIKKIYECGLPKQNSNSHISVILLNMYTQYIENNLFIYSAYVHRTGELIQQRQKISAYKPLT